MNLEGTIYCEGPECRIHAHVGADTVRAGRLPIGFVKLIQYDSGNGGEDPVAFCSIDCVMKWASTFPPSETIPLEPTDA